MRLEDSVLDRANSEGRAWPALALVLEAEQRRLTTAARLREALAARERHRWRALIQEALAEVDDTVPSPLELRYLRRVEQAHGLPRSGRVRRHLPDLDALTPDVPTPDALAPHVLTPHVLDLDAAALDGPTAPPRSTLRLRDLGYRRWRVLVALDSLIALPDTEEFRRRDAHAAGADTHPAGADTHPTRVDTHPAETNLHPAETDTSTGPVGGSRQGATQETVPTPSPPSLRFGWQEVVTAPCAVAAQIAAALCAQGWRERPRKCCPPCRVEDLLAEAGFGERH